MNKLAQTIQLYFYSHPVIYLPSQMGTITTRLWVSGQLKLLAPQSMSPHIGPKPDKGPFFPSVSGMTNVHNSSFPSQSLGSSQPLFYQINYITLKFEVQFQLIEFFKLRRKTFCPVNIIEERENKYFETRVKEEAVNCKESSLFTSL